MAVMPILDPRTGRAYHAKRRRRFSLPCEPRDRTFGSGSVYRIVAFRSRERTPFRRAKGDKVRHYLTFSSSPALLYGSPVRRRLVAKPDDREWSSTRWFAGVRPVSIEMYGKVLCIQVQARDFEARNGPQHSLAPGPAEG